MSSTAVRHSLVATVVCVAMLGFSVSELLSASALSRYSPGQTETAVATGAPTPIVVGSVTLREARPPTNCDRVDLTGVFSATSAVAPVTEMRTAFGANCQAPEPWLALAPWEPFAQTKPFVTKGFSHTYGASLAAQYKDAVGNVSPAYCADTAGYCLYCPTPTLTRTRTPSATPTAPPRPVYAPYALGGLWRATPTPPAPIPTVTPKPPPAPPLVETPDGRADRALHSGLGGTFGSAV